ncbi:hypothetical protein P3W45_001140 [Vairimorpha bombi]|jgi:6-phosphofructokinase 1
MKMYIDELVLASDKISTDHGKVYETLGLDVIYDTHSMKIYSSQVSKIVSINEGIHVHTLMKGSESVLYDKMGNKIVVTYLNSRSHVSVAIITSGGDAPGMNSCIRSIVRSSIKYGGSVYGVYRGYDGLINDYICELGWDTETHSSAEGGTVLLSFRSKDFFSRDGRKKAVLNLVKRGINSLIILGGDGSLKGALVLKNEFKELFKELIEEGKISLEDIYFKSKDNNIIAASSTTNSSNTSMYNNDYYDEFYGVPECYKENPKKNIIKTSSSSSRINTSERLYDISEYIYDLVIVGIPASIDNDISSCDYTLGCDTALNRVVESIDHLSSTMRSHQRVFVIEVMGRTCGWLSLMSGYSCLADYIFIPEDPPLDWKNEVLENIQYGRRHGKPGIFIIISEGSIDSTGNKIESSGVVDYIKEQGIDVRLLKLGHVQRGGPTSSFDRILGTLSGIKAYEEVCKLINDELNSKVKIHNEDSDKNELNSSSNLDKNELNNKFSDKNELNNKFSEKNELISSSNLDKSKLIVYDDGDILSIDLDDVITQNDKIKEYEANKDYKSILPSRGNLFKTAHSLYKLFINGKKTSRALCMEDINLRVLVQDNIKLKNKFKKENDMIMYNMVERAGNNMRIGIMQYGSRSSGMNTALNSVVQYCYMRQIEPFYILNGIEGLLNDQVIKAEMYEFGNDFNNGGSILGMGERMIEGDIREKIISQMKKYNLVSLIVIGDSSSLEDIYDLNLSSLSHQNFNVILIPAASSNNIPSTDISIGTDTALNTILKVADCAKLTSLSLKKNVFVLEVSGGHCGYLTMMASIAAGAFDSFIPERKYLIGHLSETAHRLRLRFRDNKRTGTVIFRNEKTFCSISTESFCRLLKTDGMNLFSTDFSVLGILQQGINPTPLDRIHATLMGFKSVDFCIENKGIGVVGIQGNKIIFTELDECMKMYDRSKKRGKNSKWMKYIKVCKSLE